MVGPPSQPVLVSHFYHHLIDQLPKEAEWGCGEVLAALQRMKSVSLSKQALYMKIYMEKHHLNQLAENKG